MSAKPSELSRDQWTYKGWAIDCDEGHPLDSHTWTATSPGFDADLRDGEFVPLGTCVNAYSYEDLLVEIDTAIEEMEDAS